MAFIIGVLSPRRVLDEREPIHMLPQDASDSVAINVTTTKSGGQIGLSSNNVSEQQHPHSDSHHSLSEILEEQTAPSVIDFHSTLDETESINTGATVCTDSTPVIIVNNYKKQQNNKETNVACTNSNVNATEQMRMSGSRDDNDDEGSDEVTLHSPLLSSLS